MSPLAAVVFRRQLYRPGHRLRGPHRSRRGLSLIVVLTMIAAAGVVGAPAASAAAEFSQSEGRFLGGTAAGIALDSLAGIAPASSSHPDSPPDDVHPLTATVLNALSLDLGSGINLFGTQNPLTLGAVNQFAHSAADGSSLAAAGAVTGTGAFGIGGGGPQAPATVDVTKLLSRSALVSAALAQLQVSLDAIASSATQALGANGAQSGTYEVAGGLLTAQSPVLAAIPATVTAALLPVTAAINGLAGSGGTISQAVSALGPVATVLTALGLPITTTVTLGVDLSSVTNLLSAPLTNGDNSISVDFQTGSIVVDLTKFAGGLNGRLPNTEILSPATLLAISDGVTSLVQSLVTSLNTALTGALNGINLHVSAVAGTIIGIGATGLSIAVNGSLAQVLAGTSGGSATLVVLGAPVVLTVSTLLAALAVPVNAALFNPGGAAPVFASTLVTDVLSPVTTVLAPALGAVGAVLSLVVNGQTTAASTFTETALSVGLVPGADLARVNLAQSTVGPNDGPPDAPTASSLAPTAGPLSGIQTVTVTGTGFLPGSTVALDGGADITPTVITPTSISFVTPVHAAGTVGVTVTTPGGTTTPALDYAYLAVPTTTALDPASGPLVGGQLVTVTGVDFVSGSTVSVDGGRWAGDHADGDHADDGGVLDAGASGGHGRGDGDDAGWDDHSGVGLCVSGCSHHYCSGSRGWSAGRWSARDYHRVRFRGGFDGVGGWRCSDHADGGHADDGGVLDAGASGGHGRGDGDDSGWDDHSGVGLCVSGCSHHYCSGSRGWSAGRWSARDYHRVRFRGGFDGVGGWRCSDHADRDHADDGGVLDAGASGGHGRGDGDDSGWDDYSGVGLFVPAGSDR